MASYASAAMKSVHQLMSGMGWWSALATQGKHRFLGINALVDAAGTGLAAVCLPFFGVVVIHMTPAQFALALSAMGCAQLLAAVPAGIVAERVGVWRFSIATRLARALAYSMLALAASPSVFLALSVLIGVLHAGSRGLTQSLTAAVVGSENRSETLAITRALRNIGYLCASGAAMVLLAFDSAILLRLALVINALSFVVSAVCIARTRPNCPPRLPERVGWSVLRDVQYFGLIVAAAPFASSILVLDVALPLWLVRHDNLPRSLVAVVGILNTLAVVALQCRLSQYMKTVDGSLRALRISVACFAGMAALLVLSGYCGTIVGAVFFIGAGLLLTFGEMTESPAWWTISYEMAPQNRTHHYLAAFDLAEGVANIIGPPALAIVVEARWLGWTAYVAVLAVTAVIGHGLVVARRRIFTGRKIAV